MLREFLKNTAIYTLSRFLVQGISLFLVPFYTRVFSPADYGIIDLFNIVTSTLVMVIPLQVTQAVARFYPDSETPEDGRSFASTALLFTFAAFLVLFVLFQFFPVQLEELLLGQDADPILLQVLGGSILFNGLFYYTQNQLKWMREPAKNAVAAIVFALVTLSTSIVLVLWLGIGVVGVFWGKIAGGVCGFLLGLYFGRSAYLLRFDMGKLRVMLSYSLPLVPAAFFIFAITIISRISLKFFENLSDLGLFAIGFRVSSVATMIMVAVTSSLMPIIFANYRDEKTPGEIERAFRLTVIVAMVITAGLGILSPEILIILTTPAYYTAAEVIPFLVASNFLVNFVVFFPGLRLQKQTGAIAIIHFTVVVISIPLNYLLVSVFGLIGAACAQLSTACLLLLLIGYFSQRNYQIPYRWRDYPIPIILFVLSMVAGKMLVAEYLWLAVLIKLFVLFILFVSLLFFLTTNSERSGYLIRLGLMRSKSH